MAKMPEKVQIGIPGAEEGFFALIGTIVVLITIFAIALS
jgi:hypothetical protein